MTTKLEQAARQALEALEKAGIEGTWLLHDEAITALREALAEPELNLNCKSVQKRLATVWGYVKSEQAEQEPVDGVLPCPFCGDNQPTVFEGSTFRWRVAVCNNCGAYAPEVRHDTLAEDQKQAGIESDAAAIVAWNTRAAPVRTKDLTVDEKVALADRLNLNGRIVVIDAVIAADREKNK